jgi:uncharacterized protein (TIGR02266 family)
VRPGPDPAHAARELIKPALSALESSVPRIPLATRVLEHVAAAMSALYAAEAEATTEAAVAKSLRQGLDSLTRALDCLHERPANLHALDAPATAVAQALALLYPHVRGSERRRRSAALGAAAPFTPHFPELRVAGQRITVEVDVGVLSESNFYAGVSADVSVGGIFVSTKDPLPEGTEVALYFTLGGGHTLHAEGTVRWTRGRSDDFSSGMGVAFTRLSDDDRRAVADFCGNRPPLFHD